MSCVCKMSALRLALWTRRARLVLRGEGGGAQAVFAFVQLNQILAASPLLCDLLSLFQLLSRSLSLSLSLSHTHTLFRALSRANPHTHDDESPQGGGHGRRSREEERDFSGHTSSTSAQFPQENTHQKVINCRPNHAPTGHQAGRAAFGRDPPTQEQQAAFRNHAQRSTDNGMLSRTINLTICDLVPNAEGQEFVVSRVQRRD